VICTLLCLPTMVCTDGWQGILGSEEQVQFMNRRTLSVYLIGLSLSAPLYVDGIAAEASPAAPGSWLAPLGQEFLEEYQKPEYDTSSCLISPIFASDNMTVAVSADRVFSAGDLVITVGDLQVDSTAKRPVSDLVRRFGPQDHIPIKIRRASKELTLTVPCTDKRPFTDLLREAGFAASRNDPATCADKMSEARRLHILGASGMGLAYFCA
jgi:hypothetical protein